MPGQAELVDAVGDHVADEAAVAVGRREVVGGVVGDAGDGGRVVVVVDHLRGEAEAVVRLAEAGVVAAAQELLDRLRVAVAGVEVAQRVEGQAERVDLAVGEVFEVRAVGAAGGRCCPTAW